MSFTQAEKLQLLMLCDIYEHLEIENGFDPVLVRKSLEPGNEWALNWEYQDISDGKDNPPEVSFVCDVLDMFSMLKYSYDKLSNEQKEKLSRDVKSFKPKTDLIFGGFDWNNEIKYANVTTMLKSMNRFESQNIEKNSHAPRVELYRRMLREYELVRKTFVIDEGISFDALVKVLLAQIHPSMR